jgi:hypothetical protein
VNIIRQYDAYSVADPDDFCLDPDPGQHKFCYNFFLQEIVNTKMAYQLKIHIYVPVSLIKCRICQHKKVSKKISKFCKPGSGSGPKRTDPTGSGSPTLVLGRCKICCRKVGSWSLTNITGKVGAKLVTILTIYHKQHIPGK